MSNKPVERDEKGVEREIAQVEATPEIQDVAVLLKQLTATVDEILTIIQNEVKKGQTP